MAEDIIVVGAGGHCSTLLSVLRYYDQFNVIGIADRGIETTDEEISGYSVKYSWNDLCDLYQKGTRYAVIAIGDNTERKELLSKLSRIGFSVPTIVHPTAVIEQDAEIEPSNVVCMGAKIGTKVSIGRNCVVYTGSNIDHEVQVGDHVFIAPGCNIAGRVTIGEGSFIGIGSTVKEKIVIGSNAVIGAGSVVIRDVPDHEVVAGVPARNIGR